MIQRRLTHHYLFGSKTTLYVKGERVLFRGSCLNRDLLWYDVKRM